MSTTWIPRTSFEQPRQWLLRDGSVVTEPALEETSSGRKVRVPGTSLSAYSRDIETLIRQAVHQVAAVKQTSIWMCLHEADEAMQSAAGFNPDTTKAELFLLTGTKRTVAWWKFKHPTLPIEALLYVTAKHVNEHYPANGQEVVGALVMPKPDDYNTRAKFAKAEGHLFNPIVPAGPAREVVRDNPPNWPTSDLLMTQRVTSERAMVKQLLERVRQADELECIQIPTVIDGEEVEWIDLELYETNVNSTFVSDLVDYLEGGSTLGEAVRIYEELRDCMRGIGVYLNEISESDFHRGLLGGDDHYVTACLGNPADSDGGLDHHHTLRMHLPTGTFVVDCDHAENKDAAVDRWEEAKTIASLTGEEDVLMAFARASVEQERSKRAKQILTERKQTA